MQSSTPASTTRIRTSWREAFVRRFGPGAFTGITLGLWLKVLYENRFSVDLPYWGRAAGITLNSIPNTFLNWWEHLVYGKRIKNTVLPPPLFILGIWRSGTTHLHNLLAQDDRLAYPNTYQVFYPRTFLTTEKTGAKVMQFCMPKTRPPDNVLAGAGEPQEDEFALVSLTGRNVTVGWAFPRRAEFYDRYLTFRDVSESEVAEWKAALRHFLQKLAFKYERPLVLKSPAHTCRIELLLDMFPNAKFVHIRRNPYDVFQSAQHLVRTVTPWWALQRPDYRNLEDRLILQYKEVYDLFFEECPLIPKGNFHEISFEELEKDPIGQMRGVYQALALPDFNQVEPILKRYVESVSGYKKNVFPLLPTELRERVAREWQRCFEAWGYPT